MYNASEAFFTALHQKARFEKLRGTVGSVAFTDANVISMTYSNRCSDTSDVTLGSCYIGQLEVTFVNVNVLRGDWRDKVITLEWGLVLEDESVEYIPIGVFTVTEATWSGTGVTVKASDNVAKLDKATSVQTFGTIYDLLNLACQECGLTLGVTRAECEAMPNGEEILATYSQSDIKTWRDHVGWVCQCAGAFAYAGRDGSLMVKSWADLEVVDAFTEQEREYSSLFSDFSTSYAGISVVDIENQMTLYYSNGNTGTVINLGSNPYLQYGTKETVLRIRKAVADAIKDVKYTPFNSGVLSNMAYDLGDLITCSGGIAGSSTLTCCIMAIDWTSKNLTQLQGFGADPSLSSGKSKTDKVIDGLISKVSENEVIIHTFTNASQFQLEEQTEQQIVDIRFATINPKIVNLWHEIELDVTADPEGDGVVTCQAVYYVDGEQISYSPITTWNNDGLHLMHLLYFLTELEANQVHEWEVGLIINGGTATINVGDVHASLYGQGLVATDEWDGYIDADDVIEATFSGAFAVSGINEAVEFAYNDVEAVEATDVITATFGGAFVISGITEDVGIIMQKDIYSLVSENGTYRIVSEDGQYSVESEE